jgi:hypothetical protein
MRCIECKRSFKPIRADVELCSKCRQARDRRLHCKPPSMIPTSRRDAASYQMREAKRLVAEYVLLRPGTQPHITATRLRVIRSVIAASTRL